MIAVIDACAAVEILLYKEKARKFSQTLQKATLVMAPDLYVSELTNQTAQQLPKDLSQRHKDTENTEKEMKNGIKFVNFSFSSVSSVKLRASVRVFAHSQMPFKVCF